MKVCTRCKIERPLIQFSSNVRHTDGLQSWCKACYAEWQRVRREEVGTAQDTVQGSAYRRASRQLRERHRAEFDRLYSEAKQRNGLAAETRGRAVGSRLLST